MSDAKNGDFTKAVKDLQDYVRTLAAELTLCKVAAPEVMAIKKWASIVLDQNKFAQTIVHNVFNNRPAIMSAISNLESDIKNKTPFKTGEDTADLLIQTLGPIPAPTALQAHPKITGTAEFTAGLLYALFSENHLTEIQQCYTQGEADVKIL